MESVETVLLFDYYGRMLTDKQKEYLDLRYNQDLSFGEIVTDIIYEDGKVMVESNKPYTLYINGQAHEICRGNNKIKL